MAKWPRQPPIRHGFPGSLKGLQPGRSRQGHSAKTVCLWLRQFVILCRIDCWKVYAHGCRPAEEAVFMATLTLEHAAAFACGASAAHGVPLYPPRRPGSQEQYVTNQWQEHKKKTYCSSGMVSGEGCTFNSGAF